MARLSSVVLGSFLSLLVSAAPGLAQCLGDCDGSVDVTVDEVITGVNIALGTSPLSACDAFDGDSSGDVTVDEIITAVNHALEGCPTGGDGLGVRRFSLNPTASRFEILGLPLLLRSTSFSGFLEMDAGPEDPNGVRPLSLVGISDYLTIDLRPPVGNPIILCLKPAFEMSELPLMDIGGLACGGFDQSGVNIRQDHNTNDVDPTCTEGTPDDNPAHPNVCNGPFEPEILSGDPGPGAVAITPDPETLEGGLQFEVLTETALPCGDEGVTGFAAPFVLSTGIARATIVDRDNIAGMTLSGERMGENFDCANWTSEDGPGKLVFLAPLLDFDTNVLGRFDIITVFSLDD